MIIMYKLRHITGGLSILTYLFRYSNHKIHKILNKYLSNNQLFECAIDDKKCNSFDPNQIKDLKGTTY